MISLRFLDGSRSKSCTVQMDPDCVFPDLCLRQKLSKFRVVSNFKANPYLQESSQAQ